MFVEDLTASSSMFSGAGGGGGRVNDFSELAFDSVLDPLKMGDWTVTSASSLKRIQSNFVNWKSLTCLGGVSVWESCLTRLLWHSSKC